MFQQASISKSLFKQKAVLSYLENSRKVSEVELVMKPPWRGWGPQYILQAGQQLTGRPHNLFVELLRQAHSLILCHVSLRRPKNKNVIKPSRTELVWHSSTIARLGQLRLFSTYWNSNLALRLCGIKRKKLIIHSSFSRLSFLLFP